MDLVNTLHIIINKYYRLYNLRWLLTLVGDSMERISVRRFKFGDEKEIVDLIRSARRKINIKDYSKELIEELCNEINEKIIIERSNKFHTYVIESGKKIIGVGSIGFYLECTNEVAFYNVYVLPEYQGKGIGKIIIKTLEEDELYQSADRIDISSSITAMNFYRHFGYNFKNMGHIVDPGGEYQLEKYPKLNVGKFNQYNMRPYIDNKYHKYKDFIYKIKQQMNDNFNFEKFIKKEADSLWIIQLNGLDIGFYNGKNIGLDDYVINEIYILPQYRNKKIGKQVLSDIIKLHNRQNIYVQFINQKFIKKIFDSLGFSVIDEDLNICKMWKQKNNMH